MKEIVFSLELPPLPQPSDAEERLCHMGRRYKIKLPTMPVYLDIISIIPGR
jgi:hypothetical protein